ncbi:MAG: carboxy terminal-processing peptidase [Chitinophagales bacterium]|nr:carboxy terminal-processing peptidase [Chitinophagales bacterium]
MRNKILIPTLIVAVLAAFFSFKYSSKDTDAEKKSKLIVETVYKALQDGHYSPKEVDDSFSSMAYHKLLERMDYDKRFFTQKDIDVLSKYEFKIDDEIKSGSIEFFNKFTDLYDKSIRETEKYYPELLEKPFDFTKEETYVSAEDDAPYPANDKARKERWRLFLKYRALAQYVDLKKAQDKRVEDKDTTLKEVKTDAALEAEARDKVQKSMEYYFKRVNKLDDNQRFAIYMNTITNTYDPHTDYFPPDDKKKFDEMMSGSFFGIGARLQDKEGKITVTSIIAGSPCWKQGDLDAGDEIMKVAQGSEEPVDIQGYEIDDAVKLIRGPKGTEVQLTVKKVNGATMVIPIIRGEVQIEETFARSAVIESGKGKIGYIYLPEFYADFNGTSGRRCSEDVALEVMKLKNAKVDGIILDLRYNGGGSLNDVVNMGGLFIDEGPIVQVRSSHSSPAMLEDRQPGTLYDGPMAIMINQGSASASEIMAAAMQDYKRAVIVGSRSFGKGTVQKVISLDEYLKFSDKIAARSSDEPLGALKLTIQKFYRINGGSTQLKGVTPDIELPDPYTHLDVGERKDEAALKWDEIPAAKYNTVSDPVNVSKLAALSKERVSHNETFALIEQNAERIKKQENDKTYSLNEKKFREEMKEANETAERMKELEEKATKLTVVNPKEDMAKVNMDSSTIAKNEEWLKTLQKDVYIAETVNIINDMAHMDMNVNMGMSAK